MLQTTRAIILLKKPFKENEMLLTTYTEEFGKITFILFGATSKKAGHRQAFLQPLSLVEIIADFRPNRDVQFIKSINIEIPLPELLIDPYKNTTALFLAEFANHAIKATLQDKYLYEFLHNSVQLLDMIDHGQIGNFHIAFLVRLSAFAGLTPNLGPTTHAATYFDLGKSEYIRYAGYNPNAIGHFEQDYLRQLLRINYKNMSRFRVRREERANLLNKIVDYYKIHIQGFGELKTLDILHQIFDY